MSETETHHLTTRIRAHGERVYAFASEPLNLPVWARGLGSSVEEVDGDLVVQSPMGEVRVRFVPANPYGVLDHDVHLPDGTVATNPLRVLNDGDECDVVFTLRRRPGTTDEAFDADVAAVREDLATLKCLMEGAEPG